MVRLWQGLAKNNGKIRQRKCQGYEEGWDIFFLREQQLKKFMDNAFL